MKFEFFAKGWGTNRLSLEINRKGQEVIRRINKVVTKISKLVSSASAGMLVAVIIIVVTNVIYRSFGSGIVGAYDVTIVTITVVYSLALAFCESNDGHVYLDMFFDKMPKKVQKVVFCVMYSISLVIFIMVTVGIWQHAMTLHRNGEVTSTIHIPFTPFVLLISIGIGLFCVMLVAKILNQFTKEGSDEQ